MRQPLSEKEREELNAFLLSEATSDETMQLDHLDGYLTALVAGPATLDPSVWLPRVWGPSSRDEPAFDTMEQAQRILDLILRHMDGIATALENDPDRYEPLFDHVVYKGDAREYVDGEMWARGFMQGVDLRRREWQAFFDEPGSPEILRPIHLLGADEVSDEEEALAATPQQREELAGLCAASVAWIYRFWTPRRQAGAEHAQAAAARRDEPKAGRNDPCPCGSGKKFKKCCGAATASH
jgi:uncharacterized protein